MPSIFFIIILFKRKVVQIPLHSAGGEIFISLAATAAAVDAEGAANKRKRQSRWRAAKSRRGGKK